MRRLIRKAHNLVAPPLLRILLAIRRLISRLIRRVTGEVNDYDSSVFEGLQPSDIALSQADHMDRIKSKVPASFTTLMNYRTKKKKLAEQKLPEWAINHKVRGAKLAELSGCRVPKIYQRGVELKDIKWRDGMAIKPIPGAGSEGVFCYYTESNIWDVYDGEEFSSRDELEARLKAYIDGAGADRWLVEELVTSSDGSLPRDVKFYSFYGEVGLVLEVQKYPEKKYCFWSVGGEYIDTGKYSSSKLFEGEGFRPESLEAAQKLSLEVPAPFVRIDFLDTGSDIVFGEFTPRPGGFGLMNKQTDAMLGSLFLAAETRLVNDLLDGKRFDNFAQAANE